MSVPSSKLVIPQATAAAAPPDEPPGVRARSHGLLVVPNISLKLCQSPDHSGKLVLPNTIAPAAFNDATAGASVTGTWSRNAVAPPVDRMPAVAIASLIVIGRPCSGPHDCPSIVPARRSPGR